MAIVGTGFFFPWPLHSWGPNLINIETGGYGGALPRFLPTGFIIPNTGTLTHQKTKKTKPMLHPTKNNGPLRLGNQPRTARLSVSALSVWLSVRPSVGLFVCRSVRPFVRLLVHPSVGALTSIARDTQPPTPPSIIQSQTLPQRHHRGAKRYTYELAISMWTRWLPVYTLSTVTQQSLNSHSTVTTTVTQQSLVKTT